MPAGKDMVIAVAGCVAQAEGEEIARRAKGIDLVFGPQTFHRLPEYLSRHRETGRVVVETEFPGGRKIRRLGRAAAGHGVAAFLTVQEGCDKFCSFCVVPYTRGSEFSRPLDQVLAEAQGLAAKGVREVTLLGQNVNAYRGASAAGEASLARLVTELSRIEGIERIRYTTSHPRDMSDDLIEAHAGNAKLMPYLHLPVQAGSNRILKAMNRGHTADSYRAHRGPRPRRPAGYRAVGGFHRRLSGRDRGRFRETLALVREVSYASAFSFKYSAAPRHACRGT
jgi:tRNA-2-methylthio-N6-dimethylallyladenosine synthase